MYIFIHGVTKDIDKQICVRFLQEGKSDLQELKEELKKSKMQPTDKDICGICFHWGHKDEQCKGQCNICQKWGHTQKDCFKGVEKIEAKKAKIKAKNKARKAKAKITKPESPKACFNLSLPEYVESSDSSQSSTCNKKTPAKVPDTYGILPDFYTW